MAQEQDTKNKDIIAGEPLEEDVITGAVVKSARNGGKTIFSTPTGAERLKKNKARNKGISSQLTGPGDVYTSAQDKLKSVSNPATKQDLIKRIKEMPDRMLPQFIKPYVDLMVNKFGIDTREKAANFLGQISAESIRGVTEYVYYTSEKSLRKSFGGRVRPEDPNNFLYKESNLSNYGFGITPWSVNGMSDAYYGSRSGPTNGNTFNKISQAVNPKQNVKKGTPPPNEQIDPGFYKGSTEGYAYRGHGVIQITGKVQYQRMNELFGQNGLFEKNNVDFLKNPEIVSENPKFAFLSALMWWNNHKGVYINNVSLSTTKTITTAVRGSSEGYQYRHKNVERYFYFLVNGNAGLQIDNSGNVIPKGFKYGKLKTRADVPQLSNGQKSAIFGSISYRPIGGDYIQITNNFERDNIKFVRIPQLRKFGLEGTNFHFRGEDQLKGLWNEWEQLGLLDTVLTFSPKAYSPRFVRHTRGANRPLSSHSWGIAFDINMAWNDMGRTPALIGKQGSVRQLVASSIKWGFFWGGWWSSTPDGMHFEISRLDYR